jgi:hypothetical protein
MGTDRGEIICLNTSEDPSYMLLRDQGTAGKKRPRLTVILYPLIPAIAHGAEKNGATLTLLDVEIRHGHRVTLGRFAVVSIS